jgi:alpha-L-fucosidase 2
MYMPQSMLWSTPSRDSSGSMPLGNGDIGLNVWVEEDGDLLFYLSKTDAWDENARLLKLGRLRVSLTPNPFRADAVFRQELDLATGSIRIQSTIDNRQSSILIWVDANRPVVRVEIDAAQSVQARVALELWRNAERLREGAEGHCDAGLRSAEERETAYPDTVLPRADHTILWCHRNRSSCWAATLEHQDLAFWIPQGRDPLLHRTFGALVRGEGLVKDGDQSLRTAVPQTRVVVAIHPLTAQTDTLEEWVVSATGQADRNDAVAGEILFAEHAAWWRAFWDRSWIRVSGTPEAESVSRGYELQRFINVCGGRGAFPIKFNGSIFTVDAREKDETYDADYRRWGGGYWFQNTRLTYWPMIMSGDFDLMEPWFRMYLDALPLALARAKANFGIENAAMFPETMTFWGTFLNSNYGYNRGDLQSGLSENTYIRRYWQGMLELLAVLLDAYAVSGDESLLRDKLLVLAPPFLRFYRDYYSRRDDDGKVLFKPSQSLETWHDAVNPAPDIAGLQWVLDGLLALPDAVPGELRAEWHKFRSLLPPLPTRSYHWEKRKEVIPAQQYDDCRNSENTALYSVFPYRLFGVDKPELAVGLSTWAGRPVKDTGGWRQDAIQAALLGLTDEAKTAVVKNFSTAHVGSRFPAFWGPNFDWIPDQDHGSAACIALQRMLMQFDAGAIRLLPAWPKEWKAEFRLHAPGRTVVEGRVEEGEIRELRVAPESRRRDVLSSTEAGEIK